MSHKLSEFVARSATTLPEALSLLAEPADADRGPWRPLAGGTDLMVTLAAGTLPVGRYVAKVLFRDAAGKVRQSESTVFFHGSEAAQRQKYAEVEGQIALKGGSGSATLVELVDDRGRVVQATRTTEQGNYRFKTVDQGQYKVRVRKDGFSNLESPIQAAPAAAPAKASMSW